MSRQDTRKRKFALRAAERWRFKSPLCLATILPLPRRGGESRGEGARFMAICVTGPRFLSRRSGSRRKVCRPRSRHGWFGERIDSGHLDPIQRKNGFLAGGVVHPVGLVKLGFKHGLATRALER